jgi:hypothetical protein
VSVFAYCKDVEDLLLLPVIFLCHLQHHKELCCDWWQRNASMQQFQNNFYDLQNWQFKNNLHYTSFSILYLQNYSVIADSICGFT